MKLTRILCIFGIHSWDDRGWTRKCSRCPKMQEWYHDDRDRKKWRNYVPRWGYVLVPGGMERLDKILKELGK